MPQLYDKNRNVNNLINRENLAKAVAELIEIDSDLARVIDLFGPPPIWQRDKGFPTLVHIILEQQVSLVSARAAFNKLNALEKTLTPSNFLKLGDSELKKIGFSRQKTAYCRNLAEAILDDRLQLEEFEKMDDESIRNKLMEIKGIGPWTVNIYLLMAMRRPDIFPSGDLALVLALQRLKKLSSRPDNKEMLIHFNKWRPWRSVASRILWHYYLSQGK